ncbi:MAG: hypothetical protein ACT4OX_10145 [Actinomycetota bacterium]
MTSARSRVADALCLVGGAALVASAFVHWVRRGAGSRLRGHDLVDTLVTVGRDLPGTTSANLTVLWYLVPALGAATWIAVGLTDARSRATRAVTAAAAAVVALTVLVFARLAGWRDLGLGPLLAVVGATAIVTGAWSRVGQNDHSHTPGP